MYQLLSDPNKQHTQVIQRLSDSAVIPIAPGNTDYQAYLTWLAEGNEPLPAPGPSAQDRIALLHAQIDRERTRRIERGATFSVPGIAAPVPLTGRAKDQLVYLALSTRAQGAKAAGITAPVLTLRDGADNIFSLTPDQMIALIGQAMTWFESVMAVSWAMKDGTGAFADGLPDDWREDQYWP